MNKPTVIVDSNVIVKWFIPEKYSQEAILLRDDYLYGRIRVIAPIYALLEYTNTLRKYVVRKILAKDHVVEAYNLIVEVGIEYEDITSEDTRQALLYSLTNNTTIYDAYYVILAKKYNTVMYTADEKLLATLSDKESRVRHIEKYPIDRSKPLGIE